MAQANTALRVSELDFNSIKANLKEFLRNQAEFTDYDFEGAGMSVLIDLLAYNTHYMGYYLNMAANEMFVDTAQLRNSIISHAKLMNYVPSGENAPTAVVNITVTPSVLEDQVPQTATLAKYTQFLSDPIDGIAYNFITINSNNATKTANGAFHFNNVQLKQGELQTMTYTVSPSNTKRRYTIPSGTVDLDTIVVTVQESIANTVTTSWTEAEDLTALKANSTVYFVEENPDSNGSYTITFGDGVLGQSLSNGNIVFIRYLDTQGIAANKANSFTLVQTIDGYSDNVIVTPVTAAAGGAPKETIEQIRFRAPIHYTVQNRAVTTADYQSIILSDYPNIHSASVWGGEENDPPIYGKIFISLSPVDGYAISLIEKQRIISEILENRSVLTVTAEIVDPEYVYFIVIAKAYYDDRLTSLDEDELAALIRATVIDYRDSELRTFDSVFRNSVLQRSFDAVDPSITSSELNVYLQKRFEPTLNETKNYILNFNVPLYKGSSQDKLYSYPATTVTDINGISRDVYFEEVPDSFTGLDSIDIIDPGTNYEVAPTVTITGDGIGATATAKIVNGRVTSITITNRGINYTRATIAITGGEGAGATATAVLQNRTGDLRTFYYKTNGEKVIVNAAAGSIDYDKGIVRINGFMPTALVANANYPNDTLTINIKPLSETIYPLRNRIMDLDDNDSSSIQVTIVNENAI